MLHRSAGFTLIELIVSVAILSIVTSVGIAGFISFQDNQKVLSAAKSVQQLMVEAQVKARVKETPADGFCGVGTLEGYRVVRSGNLFILQVICDGLRERDTVSVSGLNIQGFANGGSILFRTQYKTDITPTTVCIHDTKNFYYFTVSAIGQVGDVMQGNGACP